jgi:competence CoiA-like predicted nuclease
MSLVVKSAKTGDRIDITTYKDPRAELSSDDLICQICEGRMFIKQGLIVRPHFAHYAACPMAYASHPESIEHLLGKETMATYLRQQPGFEYAKIELEVPIHARKRVADIIVTFPQGHKLAVEIQLASITTGELADRTKDYANDGIDVLWCLGKDAYKSEPNRAWCQDNCGQYMLVTYTESSVTGEILFRHDSTDANTPSRV